MKYLVLILLFVFASCRTTNGVVSSKTAKEKEIKSENWDSFYKPKPSKSRFKAR